MNRIAAIFSCVLFASAAFADDEAPIPAADPAPADADTAVDRLADPVDETTPAANAAPLVLRRYALVAGVNLGGHGRAPLRYAVSDAQEVGRVFEELGGVLPGDIAVLENPDVETMMGTLAGLGPRMQVAEGTRVELVVYYSGHSDEDGLLLGEERLGYRDLKTAVDALPADVRIIVLDSCSSGALTRLKGGVRQAPFLVDASSEVKGHAFLTSASADEAAQESDRIGGSFFTHYLVSGLRGAADTTSDGRVTLSEAYQYAFHETLKRTEQSAAGPQHANYDIRLAGSGDLVMTDLRRGAADLDIAGDLVGRVFVRRPEGALVAEVRKQENKTTRLSLPPGPYEVRLETDKAVWGTTIALAHGETKTVSRAQLKRLKIEPTVSRGVPFDPAGSERAAQIEAMKLRESGETMLYGGIATAGVGACCTAMAAPATIISVLAASGDPNGLSGAAPCIATAGTCTVLGVLFAAFGVPVAWTGFSRLNSDIVNDGNDGEDAGESKVAPPAPKEAARLGPPSASPVAY